MVEIAFYKLKASILILRGSFSRRRFFPFFGPKGNRCKGVSRTIMVGRFPAQRVIPIGKEAS